MNARTQRIATSSGLDTWQRPFEGYQDQPDTAERVRLAVQSIPFGLPEKVLRTDRPAASDRFGSISYPAAVLAKLPTAA